MDKSAKSLWSLTQRCAALSLADFRDRGTMKFRLVSIVGQTATGKSALGLALARKFDGEIVSCDSTAVYRGFDIGTDKVPASLRREVPHHLIDVAEPTEVYSAARYAQDANEVIRDISARGKLPILVGGTGLYYRALTRGLFPGPARDDRIRCQLADVSRRRGVEALHKMVTNVDEASGERIQPRDERRLIRALEVFILTGRSLSDHFSETRSPIEDYLVLGFGLQLDAADIRRRVSVRVEKQFEVGLLDEVRRALVSGVEEDAHPLRGLVYRQVIEYFRGLRNEQSTRELIVRENIRYARRQLIWFRKEPNLRWIRRSGEHCATIEQVSGCLRKAMDLDAEPKRSN